MSFTLEVTKKESCLIAKNAVRKEKCFSGC